MDYLTLHSEQCSLIAVHCLQKKSPTVQSLTHQNLPNCSLTNGMLRTNSNKATTVCFWFSSPSKSTKYHTISRYALNHSSTALKHPKPVSIISKCTHQLRHLKCLPNAAQTPLSNVNIWRDLRLPRPRWWPNSAIKVATYIRPHDTSKTRDFHFQRNTERCTTFNQWSVPFFKKMSRYLDRNEVWFLLWDAHKHNEFLLKSHDIQKVTESSQWSFIWWEKGLCLQAFLV